MENMQYSKVLELVSCTNLNIFFPKKRLPLTSLPFSSKRKRWIIVRILEQARSIEDKTLIIPRVINTVDVMIQNDSVAYVSLGGLCVWNLETSFSLFVSNKQHRRNYTYICA